MEWFLVMASTVFTRAMSRHKHRKQVQVSIEGGEVNLGREQSFIDWLCGVKGAKFPYFQSKPEVEMPEYPPIKEARVIKCQNCGMPVPGDVGNCPWPDCINDQQRGVRES